MPPSRRWLAHLERCPACRERVEQARADAGLVEDIRAMQDIRKGVEPLMESMNRTLP